MAGPYVTEGVGENCCQVRIQLLCESFKAQSREQQESDFSMIFPQAILLMLWSRALSFSSQATEVLLQSQESHLSAVLSLQHYIFCWVLFYTTPHVFKFATF